MDKEGPRPDADRDPTRDRLAAADVLADQAIEAEVAEVVLDLDEVTSRSPYRSPSW
jgi:hypothetical protein